MGIIRLYDKRTDSILESEDLVLIDNVEYDKIAIEKARELFNGYGVIIYDKDTENVKYKENTVVIQVSKTTNEYTIVNSMSPETNYWYTKEVRYKEYLDNDSKKRVGDIVRYKDDQFHVFKKENDKEYDPVTNTMKFSLEKYKKYVRNKIQNSNDVIRNHGFYYNMWGAEYLQPFRETPTNDSNTLRDIRDETPAELRGLKIFTEDPLTKQRITDSTKIKWIRGPVEAPKPFFDYMIKLMNGYHSYLPDGIAKMIDNLDSRVSETDIRYIEANYVEMILRGLKTQIESLQYMKDQTKQISDYFTSKNVVPKTDEERAAGAGGA